MKHFCSCHFEIWKTNVWKMNWTETTCSLSPVNNHLAYHGKPDNVIWLHVTGRNSPTEKDQLEWDQWQGNQEFVPAAQCLKLPLCLHFKNAGVSPESWRQALQERSVFTFVATGGAYLLSQLHCSTVRRLHTFFQTSHTDFQSQWRIGSIQELGLISDLEKKGEEKRKQFSLLQGINESSNICIVHSRLK